MHWQKRETLNFRCRRFSWSFENHEIPVKNHLKVSAERKLLRSSDQTDINIIDAYACALMLHPRYKLKPPSNSKFSLFPLRSFLYYITLDKSSCFERVASQNSVRTAIKKIINSTVSEIHSLFVEANECSTLGSVFWSYVTKQMQRIQSPQNRLGIQSIPLDNFSFSTNLIKRGG